MTLSNDIHPDQEFLAFLAEGKFKIQRSRSSGAFFFYPRVLEPGTGKTDLEWIEVSGLGTVYATTVVRERPPKSNYNVAIIALDEGPHMLSRVEGLQPEEVTIGLRVKAEIIPFDDKHAVIFRAQEHPVAEKGGQQ